MYRMDAEAHVKRLYSIHDQIRNFKHVFGKKIIRQLVELNLFDALSL